MARIKMMRKQNPKTVDAHSLILITSQHRAYLKRLKKGVLSLNALFAALLFFVIQTHSHAESSPWVLIDLSTRTLSVLQDDKIIKEIPRIAIGRNGYAHDRRQGDGKTPLGEFRIAWVNPESKFQRFFGLDYPNHQRVELAFKQKHIDWDTYRAIRYALNNAATPPQDTVLGGYLGIHGIGDGDPRVHQNVDWTDGWIGVTNQQIEQLTKWLQVGTRVVITENRRSLVQLTAS